MTLKRKVTKFIVIFFLLFIALIFGLNYFLQVQYRYHSENTEVKIYIQLCKLIINNYEPENRSFGNQSNYTSILREKLYQTIQQFDFEDKLELDLLDLSNRESTLTQCTNGPVIRYLPEGRFIAYQIICDRNNTPLFILKIKNLNYRKFWDVGTSFYFLLFIPAITLVFLVLLTRFVQKTVIRPLFKIGNELICIATENDLLKRINIPVHDEFGILAGEINYLLERLEDYYQKRVSSQIMYYSVFYNRFIIMLLIDPDTGQIIEANQAAESFYGYDLSELIRMKVDDLNVNVCIDLINELNCLQGSNRQTKLDFYQRKRDGSTMAVEVYMVELNASGERKVLWIVHDISEVENAHKELFQSEIKFSKVINQSPEGIILVNHKGAIIEWNRMEEEITGLSRNEALGRNIWDVQNNMVSSDLKILLFMENLEKMVQQSFLERDTDKLSGSFITEIIDKEGKTRFYQIKSFILPDKTAFIVCIITQDITEIKEFQLKLVASLHEKEVLLKEIHHRVKNNLQVISSLLSLQSDYIKDPIATRLFLDSQTRVKSMAIIHEKLYQSEDFTKVSLAEYIENLISYLLETYSVNQKGIELKTEIDDTGLEISKAVPCGLIINELITNALKYSFQGKKSGVLQITLKTIENGWVKLVVEDNGIGLPKDFSLENTHSFGLNLVKDLVYQLNGAITVSHNEGVRFTIEFPNLVK